MHTFTVQLFFQARLYHFFDKLSFRRKVGTSAFCRVAENASHNNVEEFCRVTDMEWELLTCTKFYSENADTGST
jgi:hypothetical protein